MNVRSAAAAMSRSICFGLLVALLVDREHRGVVVRAPALRRPVARSWSCRCRCRRRRRCAVPRSRGSRGPSSSPVIGTYGSCSGQGRVRTISPWERMYTRSPGRLRRSGLPEPSPAQLVLAELLAGAQVGQPPPPPEKRAGRRAGGQRREDEQRVPPMRQDREPAQQRGRAAEQVEVSRRERRAPAQQPGAAGADRGAQPERDQARREPDHADRPSACGLHGAEQLERVARRRVARPPDPISRILFATASSRHT